MKKFLSLALSLAMVLSLFTMPTTIYAARYSETKITTETFDDDCTYATEETEAGTSNKVGKLNKDNNGQTVLKDGWYTYDPIFGTSFDFMIPSFTSDSTKTIQAKTKVWAVGWIELFTIYNDGNIKIGSDNSLPSIKKLNAETWYTVTSYTDFNTRNTSVIICERGNSFAIKYTCQNASYVDLGEGIATNYTKFAGYEHFTITDNITTGGMYVDNVMTSTVGYFNEAFDGATDDQKLDIIDKYSKTGLITLSDEYIDADEASKKEMLSKFETAAYKDVDAFNEAMKTTVVTDPLFDENLSLKFNGNDTKLLTPGTNAVGGVSDGTLSISGKADGSGHSSYLYDFKTNNETYNTLQKQVLTFDYKLAQTLASGSQTSFANIRNSDNTDQLAIATWTSGGNYKNFILNPNVWYNFMIEINPELGYVNEYCKEASSEEYTFVASTKKVINNVGVLYLTSPVSGTAYFDNVKLKTLNKTLPYIIADYTVDSGAVKAVPSTMTAGEFLAKVSVTSPVSASVINTETADKYASGAKLDENAALLIHTNNITGQLYPIELVYPDYEYDIRFYNGEERIYNFNTDVKTIKATLDMTNNTDSDANVMFAIAAYDSKGTLVAVNVDSDTNVATQGKTTTTFEADITIPQNESANKVQAFIWDSDLKPYKEEVMLPFVNDETKPTLYLVGSSHTDSYEHTAKNNVYPQMGWGKYISYYLNDKITVDNRARAGFTTDMLLDTTNYAEGYRWHDYKDDIKAGDYVLFCIGYNDGGSWNIPNERYISNLTTMYNDVVAAGATPIYETPNISMGNWDSTGAWSDHSADSGQGLKRDALISFAKSIDAPLINGGQSMADLFNSMYNDYMNEHTEATEAEGRNYIRAYFGMYMENLKESPDTLTYADAPGFGLTDEQLQDNFANSTVASLNDDTLHLNVRGAYRIAQMVKDALNNTNSSIRDYFADTPKLFDGYQ